MALGDLPSQAVDSGRIIVVTCINVIIPYDNFRSIARLRSFTSPMYRSISRHFFLYALMADNGGDDRLRCGTAA